MRLDIYPDFSLQIHIHEFYSFDLAHGYYQIRFNFKTSSIFSFELKLEDSCTSQQQNDAASCNGLEGISSLARVGFKDQPIKLENTFRCQVNVEKRLDKFNSILLPLQIELWYKDPKKVFSTTEFLFVSKRTLNVRLFSDRSIHCFRPIFFEFFAFSAISIEVHASIVGVRAVQRKTNIIDSPISEKLSYYHSIVCGKLLSIVYSLQKFVLRYEELLTSPLKIATIDSESELNKLRKELEGSKNPWLKFQSQLKAFNIRLKSLFNQLLQLFTPSKELREMLLIEFDQLRFKLLSEGFIFSEENIQSLILNQNILNPSIQILNIMKRNAYFSKLLEQLPIYCVNIDDSAESMIIEQRYLPSSQSPSKIDPAPKTSLNIPVIEVNLKPINETTTKKFFNFCIPLTRQNCDDPYEVVPNTSQNSSSIVNHKNWEKRRMTDPGNPQEKIIFKKLSKTTHRQSLKGNQLCVNNTTLKAQSLSEIALKNEKVNSTAFSSGASSSLALNDSPLNTPRSDTSLNEISTSLLEMVKQREYFKKCLRQLQPNLNYYLYSESTSIKNHLVNFSQNTKIKIENRSVENVHLIVFVHGLEGTADDLTGYRNFLQWALPECNLTFLLSSMNQNHTWTNLQQMAENLLEEVEDYLRRMPSSPDKISFVAHSLGGLITRTLCGLKEAQWITPKFHTLMTLNSPHCGLLYNQRAANWGISIFQWWKQSTCLNQITLNDSLELRKSFLYRLSQNKAFGLFRNVLLIGSNQDVYVHLSSALIEQSKASLIDSSEKSLIYAEMLSNINESIAASKNHTILVKYTVSHSLLNVPRAQQVTGRAAHIAAVDDDNFVEKLICVSAAKYFR